MADRVVIDGIRKGLDGEYEFDFAAMVLPGNAGSLTYREWHKIKVISGVRQAEFLEAGIAGDSDVQLALVLIVLERHGKTVDENLLWDAPGTATIDIRIEAPAVEETDADVPPPSEPPANAETGSPSTNGGGSSSSTSDSPATLRSRIGDRGTEPFARVTSAT